MCLKNAENIKNTISRTSVVIFLTIPFLLLSCSKESEEILPVDPVQINLTTDQILLIESENTFAFDFFKNVIEQSDESENIIISPLSITYALAMTLNGANGATRDSILKALRVSGISPEDINSSYKKLSEVLLTVDKRALISIANSVWIEKNFAVKKPFTDILTESYNAESKSFDIANPLAHEPMNAWIEAKTSGLIKNMIEGLSDNTVMLLINAIYFKGKWNSQFEIKNTVQQTFYKPGGTTVDIPMMKQLSDFKMYDGDKFILAEFPYGQGNFVMDVIVPDDNNGVNNILPLINNESFKGWTDQIREREINLSFPRFKYGYKNNLNDILTKMGMGIAFTDFADFSNISDLSLLINKVTHQAFIETNEEGTEAAAATVVEIVNTSMPPPPLVLNIDHSFLYIIRETTTNTILFMGKVADPLAE